MLACHSFEAVVAYAGILDKVQCSFSISFFLSKMLLSTVILILLMRIGFSRRKKINVPRLKI